MGLTEVKKELKRLEKDQIIELIAELYKKNKSVKEFFDFYVNPDEKELFEKYRIKVFEAFYPKRGYSLKLKDGKKAISDFKKLGTSLSLVADLMLFYVETGLKFTNQYGDINFAFYSSLVNTYAAALNLMEKESLLPDFEERTANVVVGSRRIGWGFYDELKQIHSDFYPGQKSDL
jgi:hypothetical protein